MRIGLIGYGAWGRHHARAIRSVPDATLAAIATRSPENAAAARADHPDAAIYCRLPRDARSASSSTLCDVVLPSDLHYAVARAVLDSGRHLLLEKPMALTVEHCDELIDLAEVARTRAGDRPRAAAVVAVGQGQGADRRRRDRRAAVRADRAVAAAVPPRLRRLAVRHRPRRRLDPRGADPLLRPGALVLRRRRRPDLGLRRAPTASAPTSRSCTTTSRRCVNFPGGRYAVISQTLAGWEHHQTAKLTGTDGAIWASWSGAMDRTFEPTFRLKLQARRHARGRADRRSRRARCTSWSTRSRRSSRAVRDGTPVPCTGEDGRWSVAMCLKARGVARSRSAPRPTFGDEASEVAATLGRAARPRTGTLRPTRGTPGSPATSGSCSSSRRPGGCSTRSRAALQHHPRPDAADLLGAASTAERVKRCGATCSSPCSCSAARSAAWRSASLADRFGRKPTMALTILFYSVFSGLTYFATELWHVAVLRFLVALGVGGEWAVAAALVAEVFPPRARARASGIFHATSVARDVARGAGRAGGRQRMALRVPHRRRPGAAGAVGAQQHPRAGALAAGRRRAGSGSAASANCSASRRWAQPAILGLLLAAVGLGTFWGVTVAGQDLTQELLLRNGVPPATGAPSSAKFAFGIVQTVGRRARPALLRPARRAARPAGAFALMHLAALVDRAGDLLRAADLRRRCSCVLPVFGFFTLASTPATRSTSPSCSPTTCAPPGRASASTAAGWWPPPSCGSPAVLKGLPGMDLRHAILILSSLVSGRASFC